MSDILVGTLSDGLQRAKAKRQGWESIWRECCAFAQPHRGVGSSHSGFHTLRNDERIFDSTAVDAVEQLAASLMAELLPPWSTWLALRPGSEVPVTDRGAATEFLEVVAARVQGHFNRSNFGVELHQAFLDLVTLGTATLQFEEAPIGEVSAFRFAAVPSHEVFLDGDHTGRVSQHYRVSQVSSDYVARTFGEASIPLTRGNSGNDQLPSPTVELVETVTEHSAGTHQYIAFVSDRGSTGPVGALLSQGIFETSPFITFRWAKGAGDLYGRSPVMSALPDIKTANKVVELILRNASIAATGIWLAEDDGILNPANIKLTPGSIIPKAMGSAGLTPLQAPGRFDISQLVLEDLRAQIRHTMLIDKFGPALSPRMTATEVIERTSEASRILSAVFGRLQAELVLPLVSRAISILRRRGEIPAVTIDGQIVDFDYRSPLAKAQARQDVRNTLMWLESVQRLGPEARNSVDELLVAAWLARALGVDMSLLREDMPKDGMGKK